MAFKTTRQDAPAKQNHKKFPRNTSCIRQGKSVFSQGNLDSYFFEASSRKIRNTQKMSNFRQTALERVKGVAKTLIFSL